MYGLARKKNSLYAAFVVSQFTKLSVPTLSSLASKHVFEHEQGRIQGALFATNAIGGALGPLTMVFVYNLTKDPLFPGFMFVFAAALYFLGALVATSLPFVSSLHRDARAETAPSDLEEPLLAETRTEEGISTVSGGLEASEIMNGRTKCAFV